MVIERKKFENNSLHHFPPLNNAFLTQYNKQKSLFLTADPSCDEIIQTKILWAHFFKLRNSAHQPSASKLRQKSSVSAKTGEHRFLSKPNWLHAFLGKQNYILGAVWIDKERTTQLSAANQSGLSVGVRHRSNTQSGAGF